MPSYTNKRASGGVRYAARPLRPALTVSNTARTAVSVLPADRPPSVCGKSAVKLRSRGEKCLVPCGFTGTENARQGIDTYSRKNSVLLRNKIAETVPIKNGARCHSLAAAPRSFFPVCISAVKSQKINRETIRFFIDRPDFFTGIYNQPRLDIQFELI